MIIREQIENICLIMIIREQIENICLIMIMLLVKYIFYYSTALVTLSNH